MTQENLKTLIQLARSHPGPVSGAVLAAAYGAMVHPGLLQSQLQAAGLSGSIVQKETRVELRITSEAGELIAWSNAPSPEEAILHAVLGFLRERDIEMQAAAEAK